MTRERFQTLADAYGGDIARWPLAERAAAGALAAADADWAQAVLDEAGRLDAMLGASSVAMPASDLVGRIISSATVARRRLAWLLPTGLGAGLAAACAAGVIAGVQLSRSAIEDQAATVDVAQDVLGLDFDEAA